MSIYLHFTSGNMETKTNELTRSPDTNIMESTWEYEIA